MASIAPASILPLFHFCILPSTVNHQPFLMSRILVIEDDPSIRQGIVDALEFDGFQTLEAAEGHKGLELSLKCDYDLLLLDLVLPGIEGLDILREIRKLRPTHWMCMVAISSEIGAFFKAGIQSLSGYSPART